MVLITAIKASEKYLIDLVKDLVKDYVTKDDCLILLAVTMKGQFYSSRSQIY